MLRTLPANPPRTTTFLLALSLFAVIGGTATADDRPNILIVFADDMGFSDVGCYGSEIETPNLDSLAAGGLRFRQFYNTGRCCPSRASLLTGLYSHQAGLGHMTGDYGHPSYRGTLDDRSVTIAEALQQVGYATNAVGKWHVGAKRPAWPLQRGFDRYFGTPDGGGFYFKEAMRDIRGIELYSGNEPVEIGDDWYITDLLTDYAIEFMEASIEEDKPFFTYIAHICPHWPIQARERDIQKYVGRFKKGWDKVRQDRLSKQKEIGLGLDAWDLSQRDPAVNAWESLSEEQKVEMDRRMAVYAAMIDVMDRNVGRILDTLRREGELDNTLILFLSDNGGCAESPGWERKANPNVPIGHPESYTSYRRPWANASNTPFRHYKSENHEGGIASPLIAHWPDGIRSRGDFTDQVGHIIDLMPTCLDVAGARYPDQLDGKPRTPLAGKSLLPALQRETFDREPLFWEHEGNRAVREGNWKLVALHGQPWELYDLSTDRSETNDLAATHPQKVQHLKHLYQQWTKRAGVLPWPARESAKRWQEQLAKE